MDLNEDEQYFEQPYSIPPEEQDQEGKVYPLRFRPHPKDGFCIVHNRKCINKDCTADHEPELLMRLPGDHDRNYGLQKCPEFNGMYFFEAKNGHVMSILRQTGVPSHQASDRVRFEIYKSTDTEPIKNLDFEEVQAHLRFLVRQSPREKS